MTRESILNSAIECVCGKREQDYGSPEDNFNRIATYWSTHLGMEITAEGRGRHDGAAQNSAYRHRHGDGR